MHIRVAGNLNYGIYAAYFSYCPFATQLMSYRRGTDVLAILLKSGPSFGIIGRFCYNKK